MNRMYIYGLMISAGIWTLGCKQQSSAPVQSGQTAPTNMTEREALEKEGKEAAQELVEKSKQANQAVEELGKQ